MRVAAIQVTFAGMQQPVVLFDGVCNFCNAAVNIILQQDKKGRLRFPTLQSEAAQTLLAQHGVLKKFDSVVLLANGNVYQKSTAALKVLRHLPWYWRWTQLFWIVPRPLRDGVYDWIAKNRYKWFGKKEACMIPSPEIKNRFLS